MPMHVYSYIAGCIKQSYILVQCYCICIYTHREVKRLKGSRVNREGYRGREAIDENAAYSPPDKGHYFDNEITPS